MTVCCMCVVANDKAKTTKLALSFRPKYANDNAIMEDITTFQSCP
jgi:hypothetical protein